MSSVLASTTDDSICCICLEKPSIVKRGFVNGCAHIFCYMCIKKWSKEDKSCPLCRKKFDKVRYLPHESKLYDIYTEVSSLNDGSFTKLVERFYDDKGGNLKVRDLRVLTLNDFLDEFSDTRVQRIKLRSWIMFYNLEDKFGEKSLYSITKFGNGSESRR